MVFSKHRPHDLVVIVLHKNRVTCAALSRGTHKLYCLNHVATKPLTSLGTVGSLIHTTSLGSHIATFLHKYNLKQSFVFVVCDDPLIQEGFATTVTVSAQQYLHTNLAFPHNALHTLYLGPYQDRFLHWWHRISYPLMLQLQLIARVHKLNVIQITSSFPLLLETYKKIRGTVFHPVQLITDLEKSNFELINSLDTPILKNFLYYDTHTEVVDQKTAATLIGAALYEGF